ncbi:hypothetical protein [Marinihelvus fidelis]|uniref:hypothetical protein n=1 Tax=Marinihelvus fidelis TaxID=2613842 RepID=UPI00177EF5C7|nr:hypothetical protein [Marinihelvus fidelis]
MVNTTGEAKAVKVRFLEGMNSWEVLDFNLYMSEYDVWTAAITTIDGAPHLVTTDTSCTVPYLYDADFDGTPDAPQPFIDVLYAGVDGNPNFNGDGGPDDIDRAAQGHFEMIEMGTLVGPSAVAATHVDGVPADCASLTEAWTDEDVTDPLVGGYWILDESVDIEAPSGGLFGGAAVINVEKGFMVSYDARAINGFATVANPGGIYLHTEPGNVDPNLNSGDVTDGFVFLEDGTVQASSGLTRGLDAVSYVFMHDQIMNEYATEPTGTGIDSDTEWVITFPTKHLYVNQPAPADIPFTNVWVGNGDDSGACEVVLLEGEYDREEGTPGDNPNPGEGPVVSPSIPDALPGLIPFELCFETNVIRFGDIDEVAEMGDDDEYVFTAATEIFGTPANRYHNIDLGDDFQFGWVQIELDDYPHDQNQNGLIDPNEADLSRDALGGLEGLPVTGFSANRYGNSSLGEGGDVLANYGGIFQHKGTRKVASS